MSTIDRYLLGKILRTFVPTCLGLCFLFFVIATLNLLRKADLSLGQVALALPWLLPFLLPYLIPISYTATLALVYGRLVADNEVLAFGSLGVPSRTLAWPAIFFSGVLVLFGGWLTATVVPRSSQQQREAVQAVLQQLLQLEEGEHLSRAFRKQRLSIYVRQYDAEQLQGIVLHFDRALAGGRRASVQLVAKRGRVEPSGGGHLVLVLEAVTATVIPAGATGAPIRLHLDRYVQRMALGAGSQRLKVKDFSSFDLRTEVGVARRKMALGAATGGLLAIPEGSEDVEFLGGTDLAARATLSLTPLLSALIVLPLTFFLRAGNALVPLALGLGAVCGFVFAPIQFGNSLADRAGVVEVAYLGVAVAGAVAAFLGLGARRA